MLREETSSFTNRHLSSDASSVKKISDCSNPKVTAYFHPAVNHRRKCARPGELMKAIRIHGYGGSEVLKYEDAPRPHPKVGEVLIRVYAAGVNPFDWKVCAGHMKDFVQHKLPLIPGWEVSGVIEQIGAAVSQFKDGDLVYGNLDPSRDGAYAEYAIARESELALKPTSLHHVHAAAIPSIALRTRQSVREIATLIAAGKLELRVECILPLSEARRAHEIGQSGQVRGKIVLRVKEPRP
jgi:NADPH:quinone reductase and related Zn-dependent oxidoreductases